VCICKLIYLLTDVCVMSRDVCSRRWLVRMLGSCAVHCYHWSSRNTQSRLVSRWKELTTFRLCYQMYRIDCCQRSIRGLEQRCRFAFAPGPWIRTWRIFRSVASNPLVDWTSFVKVKATTRKLFFSCCTSVHSALDTHTQPFNGLTYVRCTECQYIAH